MAAVTRPDDSAGSWKTGNAEAIADCGCVAVIDVGPYCAEKLYIRLACLNNATGVNPPGAQTKIQVARIRASKFNLSFESRRKTLVNYHALSPDRFVGPLNATEFHVFTLLK
jgi:hypothetical protein